MADSQKAVAFGARVRAAATNMEIAYRMAKRVKSEWDALLIGNEIAADANTFTDGNPTRPLTHSDVYAVMYRLDELCTLLDADNAAKLTSIIKASDAPLDWR